MIDSAVSAADQMYDTPVMRKARDVTAGAMTGAANIADAAYSFGRAAVAHGVDDLTGRSLRREQEAGMGQPVEPQTFIPSSPMWDHAKNAILDFRDAVVVQDPTLADNLDAERRTARLGRGFTARAVTCCVEG